MDNETDAIATKDDAPRVPNPPSTKETFDALATLRDVRWTAFDTRRAFEWKMGLAVWTAIAAFIALVLQDSIDGLAAVNRWLVLSASAIVLAVHFWWNFFMHRSNRLDLDICYNWERQMQETLGVTLRGVGTKKPTLEERILRMKTRCSITRNWSFVGELGLTILLLTGANLPFFLARSIDQGTNTITIETDDSSVHTKSVRASDGLRSRVPSINGASARRSTIQPTVTIQPVNENSYSDAASRLF